ncbi:Spermidine synthase [Chitinispirillum alkaliphilum]|nr:Spermidine synthase [Chitinispirillum alkaliphilum]
MMFEIKRISGLLDAQILAVLALGIVSQVGQVLVLRELLMVFSGNELSIGLVYSAWLIWGAVGARTAAYLMERLINPFPVLLINTALLSFVLPSTIVLIRGIRGFFDLLPGAYLSLNDMAVSSFVTTGPICFSLGAQFVILSAIWRRKDKSKDTSSASKTYVFEAIGNVFGGIAFSLVMVNRMVSLQSAAFVCSLMMGITLLLVCIHKPKNKTIKRNVILIISAALLLPLLFQSMLGEVDSWGYRLLWSNFAPHHELTEIRESKHGTIAVASRDGQYSFFQSGNLIYSTPGYKAAASGFEKQEAATFAHLVMAQHTNPEKVLLIGGGMRGTLPEILKHNVIRVDYVELDQELTNVALSYVSGYTRRAAEDQRVNLIHADGRQFVKQSDLKYDMIIVDIPDPSTAVLNRYYTLEFFQQTAGRLKSGGVLALSAGSSPDLRNVALVNRKATMYHTLNRVFSTVIPMGERTMFFFATQYPDQISTDPSVLEQRFTARNIESEAFTPRHYHTLIQKPHLRRINWIVRSHGRELHSHIQGVHNPPMIAEPLYKQMQLESKLPEVHEKHFLNSDFRPIGYFYTIMHWHSITGKNRNEVFTNLLKVKPVWILFPFVLCIFIAVCLRISSREAGNKRGVRFAVLTTVFTTGMSTMILQIGILFLFQSLYGFVYEMAGVIIAVFMLGLALGAGSSQKFICNKSSLKNLALVQAFMAALAACIAFILPEAAKINSTMIVLIVFSTITFIAGFLNGIDFPIAAACYLGTNNRVEKSTGIIYSTELTGACIGAVSASILLVPVFGIVTCCILASVVNIFALFTIILSGKTAIWTKESFSKPV